MGVKIYGICAVGKYVGGKGYPIGKDGKIPWHNSEDLKWFKKVTMGCPIIMGYNTWLSLGKPLKGRENIVVSAHHSITDDNVTLFKSLDEAIDYVKTIELDMAYIIGGATLFKEALRKDILDGFYVDMLAEDAYDADTFINLPNSLDGWKIEETIEIEHSKAYANLYIKCKGFNNHVDEQYLKLIKDILDNGEEKDTRAGKTRSVFSRQIRFNLKEGLPMLTTKKVFSKGVIYELLWFLKGDTNIKYLVDNNVHIWDDDAYRYYLELVKKENDWNKDCFIEHEDGTVEEIKDIEPFTKEMFLNYVKLNATHKFEHLHKEYVYGDLNNVYGYQWIKWGGHNQIQEVIDTLKKNPDDRRMIISAWNVADIPSMALPPCHFCCQFYTKKMTLEERQKWIFKRRGEDVEENIELLNEWNVPTRKLSCVWHQRSVDSGLGLCWNILSYAILTHLIAQCANMDVDELIFDGGDCHVYENHIEPLREQMSRNPHRYALPKLELTPNIDDISKFTYDDIKIVGYESYPPIKMPLSVGL